MELNFSQSTARSSIGALLILLRKLAFPFHPGLQYSASALTIRPLCTAILFLLALSGWKSAAFVFYPVGDNPLRWNLDGNLAHTNVVNPVSKAIRYYIASDAYSAAHREAEIAAVQACFDQWQSVPDSRLKFEFAGFVSPAGLDIRKDNTNVVFWAKQSLLVDSGSVNISGLRAWTSVHFTPEGSIVEGDIVLNGQQYSWFTDFNNTSNQAQFIEAVLLHEIGHLIGLDHAAAGGASLAIGASGVSPEAGLSEDEVAALRFLYPANGVSTGTISGTVRLNGSGILGAAVIADDANGNIAGGIVTRADGSYDIAGLNPGIYHVRVAPLDPANSGTEKLLRGADIAFEYANAVTAFAPTTNVPVSVAAGQETIQHFTVQPGPAMRITSLSKPTTIPNLISVHRYAASLAPGSSQFVAVSGATLKSGATLSITGDGITMGPTTFLENRIAGTIHTLVATATVASNATPGLRSFVVTHGNDVAYANGFVEIAAPFPDFNFDRLDDRFQRQYWSPWTRPQSAPAYDADADLFSNAFEFRMGTNPTNASSYLLPITAIATSPNQTTVTVATEPGHRYQLYSRPALGNGAWEPAGRPFTATGAELNLTDSSSTEIMFYRVGLLP